MTDQCPVLAFQAHWQSELSGQACGFYGYGAPTNPNTFIYPNSTLIGPFCPGGDIVATELLDGHLILKRLATDASGGATVITSMLPQNPSNILAEPELTFFAIIKVDNNAGNPNRVWQMFGSDGGVSRFNIQLGGAGNAFFRFITRSTNGELTDSIDTVSPVSDGNYYLVVTQYSFLTKTGRIIVDGRITAATNLLQNTFEFDAIGLGAANFLLNVNDVGLEQFLGSTGEIVWYDIALLSNAQINKLANSYYLKKYPSLIWTDV